MNILYILGSGASVDFYRKGYGWEPPFIQSDIIHTPLPTSNNFLNKAIEREILKEGHYSKLWIFIDKEYKIGFKDLEKGINLNIEDLYRNLDQKEKEAYEPQGEFKKEWVELYQAKSDLVKIIEELLSSFCRHFGLCFNHERLVKKIINDNANVISFNWDTLIDEALYNTGEWFYHDGYGFTFYRMYQDGKEFKEAGKSKCYLLKPHGSINWFKYVDIHWSDKNGFTAEVVKEEEMNQTGFFTFSRRLSKDTLRGHRHPRNQRLYLGQYYRPLLKAPCRVNIVPPGLKRKEFPEIWIKIRKLLAEADEVVAIGFSFNNNDKHIRDEFEGVEFKKELKISLVNPTPLEYLKTIYKKVFKNANIEKACDTFKQYCDFISEDSKLDNN